MDNLIIKDLGNGFVNITAKGGGLIYSKRLNRTMLEAEVEERFINDFSAV